MSSPLTPTLLTLAAGIHFLPGAVNSLVVEDGQGGALLVDTGLDESHSRKLLRALAELNLKPTAILNTHSHADHHGGNAHILKKFPGLPIYAPPLEAAIINYPLLEPLYLFGACPPRELQSKFLLAPSSPAQAIASGIHQLAGVELELLDVPGHAVQMYAVRMGDVLYAADALFGPEPLSKHPLTFCADSGQQKATAAQLGKVAGIRVVLPGHGAASEDLAGMVRANLEAYERTTNAVLEAVQLGAASIDDLLARVCHRLDIQMANAGAVVLNRSVISAHLTELAAAGQVNMKVAENKLTFSTF